MNPRIRQLNVSDLKMAIRLSDAEGWNQTEKDWLMVLTNPDDICIGAEYEGRIIGTSNAIVYEKKIAWIGMVLVETRFRRQGIGKMLFANILEKVRGVRSVKLDATPAGKPLYEKFGFREEYRIDRLVNMSLEDFPADHSSGIKSVSESDLRQIVQNDKNIFGAEREIIFRTLLGDYPGKSFRINDSFIFGRNGKRFNYAGPAYSSSMEEALVLIRHALKKLTGKPVALDVPESKKELRDWLETTGFTKERHFTRMFCKSNEFRGIPEKQFLILGPEFG